MRSRRAMRKAPPTRRPMSSLNRFARIGGAGGTATVTAGTSSCRWASEAILCMPSTWRSPSPAATLTRALSRTAFALTRHGRASPGSPVLTRQADAAFVIPASRSRWAGLRPSTPVAPPPWRRGTPATSRAEPTTVGCARAPRRKPCLPTASRSSARRCVGSHRPSANASRASRTGTPPDRRTPADTGSWGTRLPCRSSSGSVGGSPVRRRRQRDELRQRRRADHRR